MRINDFIVKCSTVFLDRQADDGSFPAGHNGPYYDEELPVRNTSHVLILLLKAYAISGDDGFLVAARRAAEYIADDARRPMGANFWSRRNPIRDYCNGLIGPAWIIEALTHADSYFSDMGLNKLAADVFLLHPFKNQEGVWQSVNVDGSHGTVDETFNHQLWFAAAGGMIKDYPEITGQVARFMDELDNSLCIYHNGLIMHGLRPFRTLKGDIKDRLRFMLGRACTNTVLNKAIAYHAFNTHGFALLFQNAKTHDFWSSDKFRKILRFLESEVYLEGLDCFLRDREPDGVVLPFSKYGYPYNPVGIEVALTIQTFPQYFTTPPDEAVGWWIGRQLKNTYNPDTGFMENNTDDPVTLASRICEIVYLDNHQLADA